jgi:alpha-aminoadipate carrier protein LysW
MLNCPNCDAVIDVDKEDLDEGDVLTCDECGATLNVTSLEPLEVQLFDDDEEDDEDEDFEFDEDEDEDEEEEEEEEEDEWK